jgi:hypothetical protein
LLDNCFGSEFEVLAFSVKFEVMPTLLFVNGLRFFFYSNENNEPIHVHVTKGSANGKIWLEPVIRVEYLIGFNNAEEKDILDAVNTNYEQFKKRWNEYFSK